MRVKEHLKKHWKKYVAGAILVTGGIAAIDICKRVTVKTDSNDIIDKLADDNWDPILVTEITKNGATNIDTPVESSLGRDCIMKFFVEDDNTYLGSVKCYESYAKDMIMESIGYEGVAEDMGNWTI